MLRLNTKILEGKKKKKSGDEQLTKVFILKEAYRPIQALNLKRLINEFFSFDILT